MNMKKILFTIAFFACLSSYSQMSADVNFQNQFNQVAVLDLSPIYKGLEKQRQFYTEEQWKALMQKKYLTPAYSPCYIDDFKNLGYLKYNLADDQMEFLKDNETLYLKKELGRTIKFTTLKTTYKVFELNGRLDYFVVQKEGKNSLLIKQVVKFIKPKEPNTSYDEYKPANFMRVKDQYFLALDNKDLVKIPRKKKKFYPIFGDKANQIKSFVKTNKLSYKSLGDLEKIVTYFNTL